MSWTNRADFEQRARSRLAPVDAALGDPVRTDFDLNPGFPPGIAGDPETKNARSQSDRVAAKPPWKRAAVLVGLIDRAGDLNVLLTLRPETMTSHAGQVAFPGGKIDPADASPLAAALREAHEEVGVDPSTVEVLGQGDPYLTSTGYVVAPFVGFIPSDFVPVPDEREVAAVFETPLAFLMNPANHQRHEREYGGVLRAYYAMPHNGRYIWGATAGMIRSLYDRLYGETPKP